MYCAKKRGNRQRLPPNGELWDTMEGTCSPNNLVFILFVCPLGALDSRDEAFHFFGKRVKRTSGVVQPDNRRSDKIVIQILIRPVLARNGSKAVYPSHRELWVESIPPGDLKPIKLVGPLRHFDVRFWVDITPSYRSDDPSERRGFMVKMILSCFYLQSLHNIFLSPLAQ